MKKIALLFLISSFSFLARAQSIATTANDKRYIDVTGQAEMEVIPDEIYVDVTLREKRTEKERISLQRQEDTMKKKFTEAGIDMKNLSLGGANSEYERGWWRREDKDDFVSTLNFQLKLSTSEEVKKVFRILKELRVYDAFISKINSSKIIEYKKQLRVSAVKAAKEKAAYILEAIGEEPGRPLSVEEQSNNNFPGYYYRGNTFSNTNISSSSNSGNDNGDENEVSFEKIKLTCQMSARFEIK